MSEYQRYEFLTLDRPLSTADQRWLRSLSTRAEITSTSFTNVYEWGDFKGNPLKLMERCFDAHVYTSNFGIRRFMLKLPAGGLDATRLEPFRGDTGLCWHTFKDAIVLEFVLEDEPDAYEEEYETPWMAALVPLRNELLDGDLRGLYLAWLTNVQVAALDPDELTPPVPPGLGELSAACEALVDFLLIDATLLALAAEQSPPRVAADLGDAEWRAFLAALPPSERDDLLVKFLAHDDPVLRRALRKRVGTMLAATTPPNAPHDSVATAPRTVGDLYAEWRRRVDAAERHAAEEAARERARQRAEQARVRHAHLTQVAARAAAVWDEVQKLIRSAQQKNYDRAVELLTDLHDAAALENHDADFATRLVALRAAHASKPSFIRRLNAAKLK